MVTVFDIIRERQQQNQNRSFFNTDVGKRALEATKAKGSIFDIIQERQKTQEVRGSVSTNTGRKPPQQQNISVTDENVGLAKSSKVSQAFVATPQASFLNPVVNPRNVPIEGKAQVQQVERQETSNPFTLVNSATSNFRLQLKEFFGGFFGL